MTLNDYLVAFRQGWWIVLGALVVGLGVASVVVLRQPTVYSASTQLFVELWPTEDVTVRTLTENLDAMAWLLRFASATSELGGGR